MTDEDSIQYDFGFNEGTDLGWKYGFISGVVISMVVFIGAVIIIEVVS